MGNQLGKFDHLFKNIIPNSVGGIKIFSEKDSYKITQQYDSVTKLENKHEKTNLEQMTKIIKR